MRYLALVEQLDRLMNELSLFSGAGGGLLGTKLLGFKPIGYVEWNEYCQQVIAQRIKDGILDKAPIFTDVCEFVQSGAARQYRGFVDVLTAGFPCQPHSRSGKQLGSSDDRDMWPATESTIRVARPRFVLLENNPGIIDFGYAGRVVAGLAKMGYVGHQISLSAARLGAHHLRERIWWLAVDTNADGQRLQRWDNGATRWESKNGSISTLEQSIAWPEVSNPHAYGSNDGLADRVERTRAIGNGQVPIVAATAFRLLTQ